MAPKINFLGMRGLKFAQLCPNEGPERREGHQGSLRPPPLSLCECRGGEVGKLEPIPELWGAGIAPVVPRGAEGTGSVKPGLSDREWGWDPQGSLPAWQPSPFPMGGPSHWKVPLKQA